MEVEKMKKIESGVTGLKKILQNLLKIIIFLKSDNFK